MEKIFRAIALMAMVCFQLAAFPAGAEGDAKTQSLPRFSDYRLVDSELKLVGIDSDATESLLALQLDSAGRLFAGGREALFVYEPSRGVSREFFEFCGETADFLLNSGGGGFSA